LASISSPLLNFFSLFPKMSNPKHSNLFFTFYITSIIFYYYSNNRTHYKTKLSLFYKTIPNFFILYITSITSYNYSNKNFTTQMLAKRPQKVLFLIYKRIICPFFPIPVGVANQLEKIQRDFLWGGYW
jgi:hypothetical protein